MYILLYIATEEVILGLNKMLASFLFLVQGFDKYFSVGPVLPVIGLKYI